MCGYVWVRMDMCGHVWACVGTFTGNVVVATFYFTVGRIVGVFGTFGLTGRIVVTIVTCVRMDMCGHVWALLLET